MLSQNTITAELAQAQEELQRCQERIAQLRRQLAQPVTQDYVFSGPNDSRVSLSELFGRHDDLIVVHNMGTSCAYCTLWADGFNGLTPHLEDRAAFVVISPDDPRAQERFANQRGWTFRMLSSQGTTFRKDMGFDPAEGIMPGVSTFHKNADGTITHVSHDFFGPGDSYCALWHFFDLLPAGADGWEPKYTYKD